MKKITGDLTFLVQFVFSMYITHSRMNCLQLGLNLAKILKAVLTISLQVMLHQVPA